MSFTNQHGLDFPVELWQSFVEYRAAVRCDIGHHIYLQGTTATCFYYLKSGTVKCYSLSEDGIERVLRIYQSGALIGAASFFDELPRVASAVAVSICEVIPIDRSLVQKEFSRDPALAMSMIQYLSRAVRLLSDQVDDMAFRSAPKRLTRYLLLQRDSCGLISATQDDLASAISSSRVTVNRILSDFTKRGWIHTEYGAIHLRNILELERFLS